MTGFICVVDMISCNNEHKSTPHSKYGLIEIKATMKLKDPWSWEWVLTGAMTGVLVAIRGPAAGNCPRHTCWWECHLYYTHTLIGALTHMLK